MSPASHVGPALVACGSLLGAAACRESLPILALALVVVGFVVWAKWGLPRPGGKP